MMRLGTCPCPGSSRILRIRDAPALILAHREDISESRIKVKLTHNYDNCMFNVISSHFKSDFRHWHKCASFSSQHVWVGRAPRRRETLVEEDSTKRHFRTCEYLPHEMQAASRSARSLLAAVQLRGRLGIAETAVDHGDVLELASSPAG
jgi:hypothetical protein